MRAIEVETKAGRVRIEGAVFIDATGDADLTALAGAPFERAGAEGEAQSLTTTFKLVGVDDERCPGGEAATTPAAHGEAIADGYALPRREGSIHITPTPGVMATNMTRVPAIDLDDPFALSRAEIEGRRQASEYARFLIDRVPGYEHARLTGLSTQIGMRETRRILGEYRLTREDVLGARDVPGRHRALRRANRGASRRRRHALGISARRRRPTPSPGVRLFRAVWVG